MSDPHTHQITQELQAMFMKSLRLHPPMYNLLLIREQLETNPIEPFDRAAIDAELVQLLDALQEISSSLQRLHTLLR